MNKWQEGVKTEMLKRWREEAMESNLKITYIKIEAEDPKEVIIREKVKEFLEERTEETENEKDIIVTKELWEKYDDWNRDPKNKGGTETMIGSATGMGIYIGQLNYKKYIGKMNGKTVRGYRNIRYKSEERKVNEFIRRHTIRTDSSEDRISVLKLFNKYREWMRANEYSGHEIGTTEFKNEAKKYGYKMKAAVENLYYVRSETEKKKRRPNQEKTHCITKLKWLTPPSDESGIECEESLS